MNTLEAIKKRRSIRKYVKGAEIPAEDMRQILEAAMLAPSARNCRPWEFAVIRNRAAMEQIMEISPYTKMMETASAAIVVCGILKNDKGEDNAFWMEDCGAAIQNMLLAALELGYGTCWCGCYPAMERVEALQKILDVTSVPLAIVAVGVPDEQPAPRGFYDPSRVKYL